MKYSIDLNNETIKWGCAAIAIYLIWVVVLVIFYDKIFLSMRRCGNYQCHIHSEFIADTCWTWYPKDVAYEEIQCETKLYFKSFYRSLYNEF